MAKYINRELIEKEIAEFKKRSKFENDDYFTGYMCALSYIEGVIGCQPIADVAPVIHAHWERIPLKSKYEMVKCSVCGWGYGVVRASDMIFCDHCGAKMDGKDGE